MYRISDLYDLNATLAKDYLLQFQYPWEALDGISRLIVELGAALDDSYREVSPSVWVQKTARIAPTAFLGAPCIIGPETEVRHGAFIRGAALVGAGCVVGNSVELKNVILFDHVQVPHFNYVGDSILGAGAHMGAGAVTSNIKSDQTPITVRCGDDAIRTGLIKIGAMLGDHAEVGCNSVLNPGAIIGRNATIYPLSSVRGTVPADCIFKGPGHMVKKV